MAAVAGLPKRALMDVIFLVATGATRWRLAKVLLGRVTARTTCTEVSTSQWEIRPSVIEYSGVKCNDVCISTFMIRMANNAFVFLSGWETAMKTGSRFAIDREIFMATGAKQCARLVGSIVVAGSAVTLDFGMTFDNTPGHEQTL